MTLRIRDLDHYEGAHLTMRQMVEYFIVERRTVIKWVEILGLVAHKFDGEWRFKTTDVRAFVVKHRIAKGDEPPSPPVRASTRV